MIKWLLTFCLLCLIACGPDAAKNSSECDDRTGVDLYSLCSSGLEGLGARDELPDSIYQPYKEIIDDIHVLLGEAMNQAGGFKGGTNELLDPCRSASLMQKQIRAYDLSAALRTLPKEGGKGIEGRSNGFEYFLNRYFHPHNGLFTERYLEQHKLDRVIIDLATCELLLMAIVE